MDQLRKYGAIALKYHFWILLAVLVVVGVVVKTMASSALNEAAMAQQGVISGSFSSVEGLTRQPELPNASFAPEVDKRTKSQEEINLTAWKGLYAPQADLFRWPTLNTPDLAAYYRSAEFRDFLNGKQGVEIPQSLREIYQAHAHEIVPRLYSIINVVREIERTRLRDGKNEVETITEGLVAWNDTDKRYLDERFRWPVQHKLTSAAIRYAQEDYWVYEALLRILAKTNEGATDRSNASVTTINTLAFAQRALDAQQKNKIALTGIKTEQVITPGGNATVLIPSQTANDQEIADKRYVDATGKPATAPPAMGPGAADSPTKMLPVYLDLIIDQKRLSELVVQCANSPVPLKILQIRILWAGGESMGNTVTAAAAPRALPTTPRPSGMGSGMGSGLSRAGGGAGGGGGPSTVRSASGSAKEMRPGDIHVVIRGVLTLFKPPPTPAEQLAQGGQVEPEPVPLLEETETPQPEAGAAAGGAGGEATEPVDTALEGSPEAGERGAPADGGAPVETPAAEPPAEAAAASEPPGASP